MSSISKSYLRSQLSVKNSTLNHDYGLIIYPRKLEFANVLQNESSTSIISIQNASKTLKKIRIIGVTPKHKQLFTIHTLNTYQNLAAGCSMDIPITFLCKQPLPHSIYTELRIAIKDRMVDGQINVETIVNIPSSNIVFKSLLDFNTIVTKQSISKPLLLSNNGQKKGFYKFEIPKKYQSVISIDPNISGELDMNKSINMEIQLIAPQQLGIFRCSINVIIDNDENNIKTLDIICNICQHKINFLMPKTKTDIEQINFGHLYFGQKRSFKGLLINNGPTSAHYSLYLKPYKDCMENKDNINNTHYQNDDASKSEKSEHIKAAENSAKTNENEDNAEFDEDLQPINIDYEEGTLAAYESKVITISYIPKLTPKLKGFATNYNPQNDINEMKLLLVIQSKEIIKIALRGISFPAMYHLSKKSFDFGECPVYDRRDLYFELKNENKRMSLPFEFNKIACFNTSPCSGTLLPLQSTNILLTFLPKQLGIFKNVNMKLTFNNNAASVANLVVNGVGTQYNSIEYKREKKYKTRNHFGTKLVGGINKLPIDFKPNIKIINESNANQEISAIMKDKSNINFETELPNEKSVNFRADWNTSTCIKGLYPNASQENISIIHASSVDNLQPNLNYTYSNKVRLQRFCNNNNANKYLTYQRKKRKYFAKQKNKNNTVNNVCEAKEDEEPLANIERDVVDIGLNNFYGLNEPNLDLPQNNNKNNSLYLGDGQIINTMSDRLNFFKKCMVTKYNTKTSLNSKIDENKLIKNKFKAMAETSAEIIDCQTTLTRKDLKQLKYGPNILDFGKICIHSETSKNFSIVNTLKKTILVAVKLSSENMKIIAANPSSQVIPSQHMAGFDITFTAKRIGMFEDDIILLINGIHTISFKVNAEIISMDLNLSRNKLLFEFPVIDYLDFNLVKSITLSNVLSAQTKYQFDTNSMKEISIKPCSGIIKPNKSETIQFIWSPTTLRPNKAKETEHIKLQITDGFDKLIELETVLPFASCTLSNKSIDFGVVAVGTEHTKRVHIKNSGHIQTIFRIIRCPPNLSIHPLYGKVDIGTSLALSVTYLSLKTQPFDENIIIEVRGGKTLKLSVFAQTVIPQVTVEQNEFDFGGVTIGDSKSLSIEIVNTSAVSAHLFLEMTANKSYPNGTFDICFPNEWSDLATEPSKAPIISLPAIEEDELHSFMPSQTSVISNKSSSKSLVNASRKSSRRSLKSSRQNLLNIAAQIPSDCIRVVRSLDNPNLLNNNNNSTQSLAINKVKLDTTLAASKSKKALNSPMMRRGSLLAMGQHLTMMKDLEELVTEQAESKENGKSNVDNDSDTKEELRYRILVEPSGSLKFKLTFNPTQININEYDFDLNLTMAGLPFADPHNIALRKCVFGNGLKPRIALSKRNISFFDVTVLSPHKPKQQPYHKYIMMTNQENNQIEWQFKMKDNMHHSYSNSMDNSPWKIVPDCGILEPLKTSQIGIYFSPITDELFHDNVDLLLAATQTNDVYLSIGLEGQASFPKLSFNSAFLLLPTVPLNCRSSKLLMIKNHGYENLEIRYEIIDDKAAPFINLRFPKGRIMGGNGPNELHVEISLFSAANISFTTRIDFLDMDSNRFSIFVAGMAENCILSNQPFLYNNDYSIRVENNKENVVSKLKVLNAKKKKVQLVDNNLIPDDIPTNILCDISVLIRYLEANCYLKFESDIDSFPADLVQSDGKMIFDLVQFLSGKKIPALKLAANNYKSVKNQSQESNQSQIERLIHNYAQLINFLKAHGALITMRPEYCLSCSQYIKFIQLSATMSSAPPSSSNNNGKQKFNQLKSSKAQSDTQKLKKQSERIHPMISYVCWTQLLFQTIKLFVLNTITFQGFIKQCGISELIESQNSFILKYVSNKKLSAEQKEDYDDDEEDDEDHTLNEDRLTKSNVYSMQENILLVWLSAHYNKVSIRGNQRFFQNFSELCDGIGIAYLLKSYCQHITELEKIHTRTPLSEYDKNKNASIIIQSMKKLGLNIAINCDDITKPIERNICLLILYLYQHLPNYKENNKKNIITFNGNINEEIIRKIHISNPSKVSKICYEIILKGDEQFELKNSSFIVLAPFGKKVKKKNKKKQKKSNNNSRASTATNKSVSSQSHLLLEPEADVVIAYKPRFIRPSAARLTLLAKPFPDAIFPCKIPETMTFELKSKLIESKAIKTIQCKAKLYESTKIEFEVNNPFCQDCEFNVIIKNLIEKEKSDRIPSPWHCDKKSIKIKSNESCNFSMQYLPFTINMDMNGNNLKKDKCSITFMDTKYGEFLYFVIGESLLPSAIQHIALKCKDTESISHEINFKNNITNPLLLKAQKIATHRSQLPANHKQSSLQSNPCIYDINVSSPFYVAPKQLKLSDKTDENEASNASLKVTFNPKGPGCYPCTITLASHFIDDKANNMFNIGDIRIYVLEITACSEGTRAELQFTAHANERVMQKIPIVNSTSNDWRITQEITGEAVHDFNTEKQKEFTVPSETTNYYNLIYEPKWISHNKTAQLILNNHATGEKYTYDLNCTSLEPLAIDHIVLQCQAKATIEHEFEIPNPYTNKQQSVEYMIESDLSSKSVQLRGDDSICIDSKSKSQTYKLCITPQCGGTIHGSISFIEKNNKSKKFIWYAMELNCSSPEPEKSIKISAYLREVVCIEINLSNPLSEMIEFTVSIVGEGLFGAETLTLRAKQDKYIYKLHYSPLITGEVKGSISFSNDISGEFWYSLILIGKKPPSIQLKDMICSVGNVCNQEIKIENPFNEMITLSNENILISNKKFYLQNKMKAIRINKSSVTPICLCYRPSLIGIKQECDIILKHNKLGEWNYNVFGLGKEPNIEKKTIIYAMLHSRISKVISFQNPFDQILKIQIELELQDNEKVFQMFIKKKQKGLVSVAPNSSLQIPIFFSPDTMKQYSAKLVIGTNNYTKNERELVWNYPIVGLAQFQSSQLLNVKCNAREIFHKIWKLPLNNYHLDDGGDNDNEFKIEIEAADTNEMLDKSLQIDLIQKSINNNNNNNNNALQIEVLFEPLKAFNGTSKLHIINKHGVSWIFQLNFIVNKAAVDDIIKIESQLHCTSSICFVLDCIESMPFRAYFTADSPFEFDVDPKQGSFEQQDGQQFIVSFTPNEYGAALNGKLIIETSVMEWSYKVIGTHPTYIPPNINSFKPTVDNKISKKMQFKRQKEKRIIKNRNFLKKNISAAKKQNKF